MSSNYCLIPECYIDSCLVEVLLNAGRDFVNHQKGNGTVAKTMKLKFGNDFCVGIIDEDKEKLSYLDEFNLVKGDEYLKFWRHKTKNHFIIQVCPVIEKWFLGLCKENGINLYEYGLPENLDDLRRVSKSVSSRHDQRFIRLFRKLGSINCEPVERLKYWLDILKANKYNFNNDLLNG